MACHFLFRICCAPVSFFRSSKSATEILIHTAKDLTICNETADVFRVGTLVSYDSFIFQQDTRAINGPRHAEIHSNTMPHCHIHLVQRMFIIHLLS